MKAFFATAYGGPEVMRLGEMPDPAPGAGEAAVRDVFGRLGITRVQARGGDVFVVTFGEDPGLDALEAARRIRQLLDDELGIDPENLANPTQAAIVSASMPRTARSWPTAPTS